MKPLFTWAGGKTRMLKHYLPHMPKSVGSYCEPFFGGGAMFIHVVNTYSPKKVLLNDINEDIIRIYVSIRDDLEYFLEVLDELDAQYIPLTKPERKEFYYATRYSHAYDYEKWSETQEAATLYFLMKTSFNGIYQLNNNTNGRYGTPAGLLNQKTSVYDLNVVRWWYENLQNCELTASDWKIVVDKYPYDFVFLDPPYRDTFTSYGQLFSDKDQEEVLRWLTTTSRNSFLCNKDTEDGFFDNLPVNVSKQKINTKHTAGRRKKTDTGYKAKKATEIFMYNY